jgi:ribosomal protein L37AE/L43A
MIEIDLTTAVGLYSTILILIIVVIWLYTEVAVRRTQRVLAKQSLWRCVFCGYSYLDESAEEISQCPRCESFNSVGDKHAKAVRSRTQGPLEEEVEAAARGEDDGQRRNPSHRKRPHQKRRGGRRRG